MRSLRVYLLTGLMLAGCSKSERKPHDASPPSPTASPREPASECRLELAIYTASEANRRKASAHRLKSDFAAAGWSPEVDLLTATDYPLPEDSYIEPQVGEAGLLEVKKKPSVLRIIATFEGTKSEKMFRAAHSAVSRAARDLEGYVWDQGSWSLYAPAAWPKAHDKWSNGQPFVFEHVTLQLERNDSGERLVSVGLGKFGLPELLVETASPGERERLGMLMNLLAQTLVERQGPPASRVEVNVATLKNSAAKKYFAVKKVGDASGVVEVGLDDADRGPRDPHGTILSVRLHAAGSTLGERQAAALNSFLGKTKEEVYYTDALSDAWKAASSRAVKRLMELKPRIQAGLKANETLYVKAGFSDSGPGREWMWIDVVSWKGKTIRGRLSSEPKTVKSMKLGQDVTLDEVQVVDYLLTSADGAEEGNETAKVTEGR